ncbi:MAG: hypothetical protein V1753_05090, partial [Pseudomonadota bacterium]
MLREETKGFGNITNKLKFEEKYKEYLRQYALGLARVACLLIVILVPLFCILDYCLYPAIFFKLALVRLACIVIVLLLFLFTFTPQGKRYGSSVEMAAILVAALSISIMIRFVGGYNSPYYAGLNLLIIGVAVFVPWGVKESIVTCLIIYASYAIPIEVWDKIENPGILINNNIFLLSTMTIAIMCTHFTSQARKREFKTLI